MYTQPIILMYNQQMARVEEHTSSSKTLSNKKKKVRVKICLAGSGGQIAI